MLNITQIRIKKINRGDLLCYASMLIEDSIVIDGIKLLEGAKGRYILMPIRKIKGKEVRRNYIYPVNNETREYLLELISNEYDKQIEE